MTTATEAAAPVAPVAPAETHQSTQEPASPAQAAPAAAPTASTPEAEKDPNWLPARLERERRSLLKQLGVEDVGSAQAALDELKKRRDAEKTETDRLRGQLAELESKAKRAAELETVIAARADVELKSLTDAQREAVMKLAGEDPSRLLSAIDALRPTWATQAPAPVAAPPQTQAKPAPISTSPAGRGPSPEASEAEDVNATYARLAKTDPQQAAAFRLRHFSQFFAKQ